MDEKENLVVEKSEKDINKTSRKKADIVVTWIVVGILLFAVVALIFTLKGLFFPSGFSIIQASTNTMNGGLSRMSLTPFDVKLAKEFMDKDNDGKCDVCGMDVNLCIEGGQLQCNMDSHSTIGVLGSQHIHADWKIYINNKELDEDILERLAMDMSKMDNQITSSFIHLDKGAPLPERTKDVLHMHASGVPLWVFFESVGMKFDKECLVLDEGEKYCNDSKNSLKFFVNGVENIEFQDYVFNDLDKILISYGLKSEDVKEQINSITDFAKNH